MATKKDIFLDDIIKIANNTIKCNTFGGFPMDIWDFDKVIKTNMLAGCLAGAAYGVIHEDSPIVLCAITGGLISSFYLSAATLVGRIRKENENIRNYNSSLEKRARRS